MTILHTSRLRLEPLQLQHLPGLHRMNSQPEVMRYISGAPETLEQTRAMIERVKARWALWGYGWWALIERDTHQLVGAAGVQHLDHDAANEHELGWRLHPDYWGRGYAIEAARRMAAFAFDELKAPVLTAVCDPANTRSQAVMTKLGMHFRGRETWYQREVLTYCIERATWAPVAPGTEDGAP